MDSDTIILGAGAAGLAMAACLKKQGRSAVILERSNQVGGSWRNHYDRLHLHTNKASSGLPFYPMPDHYPKYPSRNQVVEYLESYAHNFDLQPLCNQEVRSVTQRNGGWEVSTTNGSFNGRNVVVATGYNRKPRLPSFPGKERFQGKILHSSEYKNGQEFNGKNVPVVGFGNSACEIAICLHEHGANVSMSVRSPVNIIPRDILGIPVLSIGILMSFLPPRVADRLNAPLVRLLIGDYTRFGLSKPEYGPIEQIIKTKTIPLLDIGTLGLIKEGKILIHGEVKSLGISEVLFRDGTVAPFDAIIMGTGYSASVEDFLPGVDLTQVQSGSTTAWPGLYFCGFFVSPTGMLREIGLEARSISELIQNEG